MAVKLDDIPMYAMLFIFTAAIFVGGYLVVDGLESAGSDNDGNASTASAATLAAGNMTEALDNIVTYAPTWGTIIGVAVLIGIVLAGFFVGRNRGMF